MILVRVHVVAVVLGKDIAGMNPAVTIGKLQPELFPLVLPEQLHGFGGQRKQAAVAGFGFALINALAFGVEQGPVNPDPVVLKVYLFPSEAHDLTTAAACDDHQLGNELPFEQYH